jgi:hypothetical protein
MTADRRTLSDQREVPPHTIVIQRRHASTAEVSLTSPTRTTSTNQPAGGHRNTSRNEVLGQYLGAHTSMGTSLATLSPSMAD